jgi:hypothetical protein
VTLSIPLGLPPTSSQQSFIDHFNSLLKDCLGASSGAAGFQPDGTFRSTTSGPTALGDRTVHLTWVLTKAADGVLASVEVISNESGDDVSWHDQAHNLVSTALASALSNKKTLFFRRVQLHYVGSALDGEYWLPGFRFAPAISDDDDPQLLNAERVVHLDLDVEAVDGNHAHALASEVAARHASRLAIVLNKGLYTADQIHRWVLPEDGGKPAVQSRRFQSGFYHPSVHATEMPPKGAQCKLGAYLGSMRDRYRPSGGLLTLPKESRSVLRFVEHSGPPFRDAFDACARLYRLGLLIANHSPSAGLAYRVAAIDAISQVTGEFQGASDFIRKHVDPSPDLESLLEFLYTDIRSAHFHAGKAPLDERLGIPFHPPMTSEFIEQTHLTTLGYEITRAAIVQWVLSRVRRGDVEDGAR